MIPTREVYWNISNIWLMYVLFAPAAAAFLYGFWRHFRAWGATLPADRTGRVGERLTSLATYVFGQARVHGLTRPSRLRHTYAGTFHAFFFFGLIILFIGTLVVMAQADFGLHIMQGTFYLWFQSLTLDLAGLFAIVGLCMAMARRLFFKPERLENTQRDLFTAPVLLVILVTGFTIEGLRIVATNDPWAAWSPVGASVGRGLAAVMSPDSLRPLHASLWWFHLVTVLALIAALPYTKFRHVFTAPLNIYFRPLEARGAILKPIDMETAESFGVKALEQFGFKNLLDLDACTECGRCQDACPAYASGKPLSPKKVIFDLRDLLHEKRDAYQMAEAAESAEAPPLVPDLIGEDALWACTTCMACMEACPVFIEHVPKIVDMRRYLVMEEGRFPDTMQQSVRSLESRGHPFPGNTMSRLEWTKDLDIRVLGEGESAEYLYWVGCATALNARNHSTARSLVEILKEAKVDFGILGEAEACTGDSARRMGNEYLFQTLAKQNIETFESRSVKKIITTCPHCLNSLKNEYPAFGTNYEVVHHSQLLADLVASGRYKPQGDFNAKITFHDSCYLGRYNGVFDQPREVIAARSGTSMIEMERHREASFCCGAGGGRFWMEEPSEQRVSNLRAQQALGTGADVVGVSCPFCMTMMEEAVNGQKGGRDVKVLDIAEVLRGPERK